MYTVVFGSSVRPCFANKANSFSKTGCTGKYRTVAKDFNNAC